MKRFIIHKLLPTLGLTSLMLMLFAKTASAGIDIDLISGVVTSEFIWSFFSSVSYGILTLASWFLTATGVLLNVSLTLTLQIRDFVTHITGVYEIWLAIRDLSGTFIIFFVLWAAFQMILSIETPNLGNLLKNIVVAGVLINFSFFLTGLLIDASNVISAQIYRQMIPEITETTPQPAIATNPNKKESAQSYVKTAVEKSYKRGGISDVFMSAFNMTQIYSNNGQFTAAGGESGLAIRMTIIQMTGAVAMFVAGFSFIAASIAFLIRLAILVFMLAFSPVFFAARVIPQLDEHAKKGWSIFKGQLIFMPVYLLLMYMALKVVATGDFTGSSLGLMTNKGADFWQGMIGLVANFAFVIIILLIPLAAAVSMGGMSTNLANKWTNSFRKWSTGKLKAAGAGAAVGAWRNTGGRLASLAANSESFKADAARSRVGAFFLKGARGMASGYDAKLGKQVEAKTKFGESLGQDKRAVKFRQTELSDLRREQVEARRNGDKSRADALDKRIERAKEELELAKTSRKEQYAQTTNKRTYQTMWTKIARKDKEAAAKMEGEILKKRVERYQKELEKHQEKIKKNQDKIDDYKERIKTGRINDPGEIRKTEDQIKELEKKIPTFLADEKLKLDRLTENEDRLAEHDPIS